MNRPSAAIIATSLLRDGLSLGAVAALLAGCGGSQSPLSLSPPQLAQQQSHPNTPYNVLHTFERVADDGTYPKADLIDIKGTLYGTTVTGGSNGGYGTVFSITPSGQETVLHSFGAPGDGVNPTSRLLNVNGTLYGTTSLGGKNGGGTVFSLTLNGAEKVLHNFESTYSPPEKYGAIPEAGLTNVNGTLYGTTSAGGANACDEYNFCGTVFSITTSGKFKVLHNFGQGHNGDGVYPYAPLLNVGGLLYGTTSSGGAHSSGTVFSITTSGRERTVYSFGANANDGADPMSGLINVAGTLYGTTMLGGSGPGSYGDGSVFAVTTDGVEKMLFSFNGSNGSQPVGDLKNVKGVLYGTTTIGGARNLGTVFRITTSGKQTVLHSFANGYGQEPHAGLTPIGGTLYGTTFGVTGDKSKEKGNVFSLAP